MGTSGSKQFRCKRAELVGLCSQRCMKVAILCGGQGTRFREVSGIIPKPMAPIGDRPILWHIMKLYSAHGFNEFVLLLGYKGECIRECFLKYASHMGIAVDILIGRPLRTDPLYFW